MLDNQLIILIISILTDGMKAFLPAAISTDNLTGITTDDKKQIVTDGGFPVVAVKRSNQPTIQGANTAPTLYLTKLFDKRFGWVSRSDVWDKDRQMMVSTQMQQYETSFQITATATQNPKDPHSITASDIANAAVSVLQSRATIALLESKGIGVLRITEIRNPYFVDDRDQFEASPSFDFVLTHKQVIVNRVPVVTSDKFQILDV